MRPGGPRAAFFLDGGRARRWRGRGAALLGADSGDPFFLPEQR